MRVQQIPVVRNSHETNRAILLILIKKTCCCNMFRSLKPTSLVTHGLYEFELDLMYGYWNCWQVLYRIYSLDILDPLIHKSFVNFINEMCTYSIQEVPKYRTMNGIRQIVGQEHPGVKVNGAQKSIINSLIMSWSYKIDEWDLFDVAADLFIKLCQGHTLGNGNKRFAVIFTTSFLNYFGFFLISPDDNSEINPDYLDNWLTLSKTATTRINCFDENVKRKLKEIGGDDADDDQALQEMKNCYYQELDSDELHKLIKHKLEATSFFIEKHVI